MKTSKKKPAWDDVSWIQVGTKVRFTGSPIGEWRKPDKSDHKSLRPGMTGRVIGFTKGYPPHPCPDHSNAPDCICGENGTVSANERQGIVAWDAEGGEYQRLISRDDEGKRFERIC